MDKYLKILNLESVGHSLSEYISVVLLLDVHQDIILLLVLVRKKTHYRIQVNYVCFLIP